MARQDSLTNKPILVSNHPCEEYLSLRYSNTV